MLERIVAHKRVEVAARAAAVPLPNLLAAATRAERDFLAALRRAKPAFIFEIKPTAPSAGRLREVRDLEPVFAAYHRLADAVSVLVDETFFGGSYRLLADVRRRLPQPLLCKDVVVDRYQVAEARVHGADAVLLMLAVLDDPEYLAAAALARSLGMAVVTEVRVAAEMARAARLGAAIVGINNRDLRSLAVDLATTPTLAAAAPPGAVVIAESGVTSRAAVVRLRGLVDGFLIGSAPMAAADPARTVRELVFGPTKVCGLTDRADAQVASAAGATHGGLVFAPESPRLVTVGDGRRLRRDVELRWVGVFANQPRDEVIATAREVGLDAVQLHGDEDAGYVADLRRRLPEPVEVWTAVPVGQSLPRHRPGDRVLFDAWDTTQRGGTGRSFDWSLLAGLEHPDRCVLAGGLAADNAARAEATGIHFLDAGSRLEGTVVGRKSTERMAAFFTARRTGAGAAP
ncbi:MAG: bifunctional indole-3-glycerol-phosphate synthase TrpC/phosphoribosylanthranilate isomerase TrpF [Gemmatimonadetes bacterium]|nr:bifunctional indole-3-glycerol-phosphate synthase TrpC/phosphoribosylanthranilate isomerase TrpF [Gemmatimonadota bacterium]